MANKKEPDSKKIDKVYTELVKIYKNTKLTVPEILLTLSNLTYTLGASIGGYKGKGPGKQELELEYAQKPTIDKALMLTGLTQADWVNDLDKKYDEIVKELKDKKSKDE